MRATDQHGPAAVSERVWIKVTTPESVIPSAAPGTEVQVLLPDASEFDEVREKLLVGGALVRQVKYLTEDEVITERDGTVTAIAWESSVAQPQLHELAKRTGAAARAAQEAFSVLWEAAAPTSGGSYKTVAAAELVPESWLPYLPHPTLNPAQAAAIPRVRGSDGHLVVVAPTGAGKTVVGMAAALRSILDDGRKAAWLVPQRSLTDELAVELESWRQAGLRVERLSGESTTDIERIRTADLWVATTEKFEAMCRTYSLRDTLAEVGCVVVDEIHLLGDGERGPVLEALLSRMRDSASRRIVGLSATVSNADEIAEWLSAELVRLTWRPTKLSWQLPVLRAQRDPSLVETARMRLSAAITGRVTGDGGSVVVFCGSKRNVRRTALVIASARGADTGGVRPDDVEQLHRVCAEARVGLHYKGWEHRREAEAGFRRRELDVLVATTTVAAGVNLPARAVVVQDTEVGMNPIDVATVLQMFGRAGRLGAGEHEGSAFLVVTENERPEWHRRLAAGNTVSSRIESSLSDHVLAEVLQRRISSPSNAERWWSGTLAHHQGSRDQRPVRQALGFLGGSGFLTGSGTDEDPIRTTELGTVTARLMVPSDIGQDLRLAIANAPIPDSADEAEKTLIDLVAAHVPRLTRAALSEETKVVVSGLLRPGERSSYQAGDLAKVALSLVATSPEMFRQGARTIAGIPYATLFPVLEEAPRYLHWIGTQGVLGTVHPWSAIVAADLSRRIRWRRCQAPRGSGRLLWMCEQMATPTEAPQLVPELWRSATARGLTSPDWSATGRPVQCRLDDESYGQLLAGRATDVRIDLHAGQTAATGPEGGVLVTWSGRSFQAAPLANGRIYLRDHDADGLQRMAAVFTKRGDYRATGWLDVYNGFRAESD